MIMSMNVDQLWGKLSKAQVNKLKVRKIMRVKELGGLLIIRETWVKKHIVEGRKIRKQSIKKYETQRQKRNITSGRRSIG